MREVQGSIRSTVITSKPVKAHLEPLTGPMGVNPPRMLPPYPICLSHNVISALGQSFCSSLGTQLPAVMSSLQDHTTPSDGDSSVSTYLNPNTQCSQVTVQGFLTASDSVQKNIRESACSIPQKIPSKDINWQYNGNKNTETLEELAAQSHLWSQADWLASSIVVFGQPDNITDSAVNEDSGTH